MVYQFIGANACLLGVLLLYKQIDHVFVIVSSILFINYAMHDIETVNTISISPYMHVIALLLSKQHSSSAYFDKKSIPLNVMINLSLYKNEILSYFFFLRLAQRRKNPLRLVNMIFTHTSLLQFGHFDLFAVRNDFKDYLQNARTQKSFMNNFFSFRALKEKHFQKRKTFGAC